MKSIFYKISTIITLSLQFLAYQANATTTVLFCDNCTAKQQVAKLDLYVQLKRQLGTFVIIDAINATSAEVILTSIKQPQDNAIINYNSTSSTTKAYLLDVNDSLLELQNINQELLKVQLEVEVPSSTGFVTVATILLATDDFDSLLAEKFNSTVKNFQFNEIKRRAQRQLELLSTSLSINLVTLSKNVDALIKSSSSVVKLSDGSTITIGRTFKLVSYDLVINVKADRKTAFSPDGISIPLSKFTMNGFKVSGNYN